ncbi:MAG: SDR family oxidoreductase, partial [Rhizobiaceae bacterium]
ETPMSSEVFRGPDGQVDPAAREAYIAGQIAATPLGILGTPEDIAHAVLYLVSDASRFVTGQVLTVCGGFSV